ncbi:MAG: nuclease-related domain-containing protein [Kiritimatiellia bacterium]
MNSDTTRADMRGVPGDAARKRGINRIVLPLLGLGFLFGLGGGIIFGAVGLSALIGGLLLFLALLGFVWYARRQPAFVYGYFKGARGEEMTAGELAHLPMGWTVFNGIVLPDGRDIDHLAVGPQGLFVIETKHWSGQIAVEQGQILANGRAVAKSPIVQVRHAMNQVAETVTVSQGALRGILCFVGRHFMDGAVNADEILVCSHLNLVAELTRGPILLDAAAIARCVSLLGTFAITEGL